MKRSHIQTVFDSKAYMDWKKNRDAEGKLQVAVLDRLDNVTKAIGALAKIVSGKPHF